MPERKKVFLSSVEKKGNYFSHKILSEYES